jgi:putative ABC transport system permease protein
MSDALGNIRLALRTLGRNRTFATIAVLSLGVAIALNTTVYALIDAMVAPQLDVRQPEQVFFIKLYADGHRLTPRALDDAFRAGLHGYEGVTGFRRLGDHVTVEHGSHVHDASAVIVRSDFFAVAGIRPMAGRVFGPADEGSPVAIISDRLAAQLFPDGESPLGEAIDVDGRRQTIIGVVRWEPRFYLANYDLWILPTDSKAPLWPTLIRLRSGIAHSVVKTELSVISERLAISVGQPPGSMAILLGATPVRPFKTGPFHLALVASAIAILLVACANLANLQLARGLGRGSELALRSALGASRRRLTVTLMWENAVLAAGGLAVGLIFAAWSAHALRALVPSQVANYVVAPRPSWGFVPVATLASVVALLAAGLWPAWRVAGVNPNALLRNRAGTGAHRHHRRLYAALIVVQIALALPLLSGAALLARSAWRLEDTSYVIQNYVGFNPAPIIVSQVKVNATPGVRVRLDSLAYSLGERLRGIRGVSAAAVTTSAAPEGRAVTIVDADGRSREIPAPMWSAGVVTTSYLRTLGRALSAGRPFSGGLESEAQVIVDEPTARFLWPGVSAIGRRIKFGDFRSSAPWARVTGVLRDARDTATISLMDPLSGHHLGPVYRTFTPSDTVVSSAAGIALQVYARSESNVQRSAIDVRHALWATPGVLSSYTAPADNAYGLTDQRAGEGFIALIFSTFALLGTGLAMMGVFGVVAYSVSERRREFAVRVSLGATPRIILRTVLREGNILVLLGTAVGLFLTKRSAPWLGMFLTGVNDLYDAPLFAALALALGLVVFLAALVPALRVIHADPVEALRND